MEIPRKRPTGYSGYGRSVPVVPVKRAQAGSRTFWPRFMKANDVRKVKAKFLYK